MENLENIINRRNFLREIATGTLSLTLTNFSSRSFAQELNPETEIKNLLSLNYNPSLALKLACISNDSDHIHNFSQLREKYPKNANKFLNKSQTQGIILDMTQTDMQGMVVAFSSTNGIVDLIRDIRHLVKKRVNWLPNNTKAHRGFVIGYNTIRSDLLNNIIQENKPKRVYLTGHSLGGAMAILGAIDIKSHSPSIEVIMYNYGGPKIGDCSFVDYYDKMISNSHRIITEGNRFLGPKQDPITQLPRNNYFYVSNNNVHLLKENNFTGSLHNLSNTYIPALKREN